MPLPTILSMESDCRPYLGRHVCDGHDTLLRMVRRMTESQARKYVGHGIAQNTYTNEYHRRSSLGGTSLDSDLISVVGDKVYVGMETDMLDGHVLQLNNGYVTSVSDIREDTSARFNEAGKFAADTALTASTDWYMEMDDDTFCVSGRLIRRSGNWSNIPGTIRVTYTAGFTAAQLNDEYYFVKGALLDDMRSKFNYFREQQSSTSFSGQKKKETWFGDYAVEYDTQSAVAQTVASGLVLQLTPSAMARLQPIRRLAL